jgi:hypothetical protein
MLLAVVSILSCRTHLHRLNGAETLLQAMGRELANFGLTDCSALPTAEELLQAVP